MVFRSSARRTVVAAALAVSAACSSATEPGGTQPGGTQPAALQALPRALSASELTLITASNDFSFSLFRQLSAAQKGANVFTSPLSASVALGMTMEGAAGTTYDQMRAALALGTASDTDIMEGYKSLMALLRGLDATVDFRIANSIWYRTGFPFTQAFLDNGKTWFDAQVTGLDFASPSAASTINAWVSDATASKIPAIVDQIDPSQVMFLINAIYFKGSWRDKFDAAQTVDAPFHAVAGDTPGRLMHRTADMSWLSTPDFQAVDLPYGNGAFTMTVVLPLAGRSVETIAASLQSSAWSGWASQFHTTRIDLYLPKFTLTWDRVLNNDLESLGMVEAFDTNGADFTRMSPRGRELFISIVKQKTFVDVNEDGTEAAAATNVGITYTSLPVTTPMRVDRPFIFVIRERLSGTVVFMGKIVTLPVPS